MYIKSKHNNYTVIDLDILGCSIPWFKETFPHIKVILNTRHPKQSCESMTKTFKLWINRVETFLFNLIKHTNFSPPFAYDDPEYQMKIKEVPRQGGLNMPGIVGMFIVHSWYQFLKVSLCLYCLRTSACYGMNIM